MAQMFNKMDYCFNLFENISIKLSKHLFVPRETEKSKKIRAFMFVSTSQYIEFFTYMWKEYYLENFTNIGKVVIYFTFNREKYSMLVSIEKDEGQETVINVISIEAIKDRHYVRNLAFNAVENRIRTNYTLREGYIRSILSSSIESIVDFKVCYTSYFNKIAKERFKIDIDDIRLKNSLIGLSLRDGLNNGTYWFEFSIKERPVYIRVSYDSQIINGEEKKILIFLDLKNSKYKVEERLQYKSDEKFVDSLKEKDISVTFIGTRDKRKDGLKIVSKIEQSSEL